MTDKQVLVVRGGWDGHQPVAATEVFLPFLRANGFEVRIEESPAVYADPEAMAAVDLIVQCVTMSEITRDQVMGLRAAVAAGTGLTGWHGGIADSYRASSQYLQLVGGQFAGHPSKEPTVLAGEESDSFLTYRVRRPRGTAPTFSRAPMCGRSSKGECCGRRGLRQRRRSRRTEPDGPTPVRSIMTAESELAGFVAKFTNQMQDRIRGCRAKLRKRFPDAVEMVYDNYNFLVLGFGPTDRPSEGIFSLAAHAHGVILCFLQRGPELPDPTSILRGSGKVVRNVILSQPEDLDRPDISALIDAALELAGKPMSASTAQAVIIKSVSAKQRPRR